MRNNTKRKFKQGSNYDWSSVRPRRNKSVLFQRGSRKNRLTPLIGRFFVKLVLCILFVFITYEVFFFAKNVDFRISLPEKVSHFLQDITSRLYVSKVPTEYQIYENDISLPMYTSFDITTVSSQPTVRSTFKSGDSIDSIFKRLGFASEDASSVQGVLTDFESKHLGRVQIKAGAPIEIEMNQEGLPVQLLLPINDKELLKLVRNTSGIYAYSILDKQTKTGERILFGGIESSFAAAATKSGMSYDLVDDLVDIFSDRVSFHKDFRKGDRFTVIYQENEMLDGSRAKSNSGTILAAALEVGGKNLVAVRFVGEDGKARYFNENGQIQGDSFLRFPVKFSKISSYFTTARFHPVLKIKRPHNGVDFAAPIGTPVRTVGDGVVQFAGRQGGHGIIVEIKHSDRFVTGYSHLSSIAPGLKRGVRVQRGQVIGAVGMTGLATGPHLHFSLFDRGKYVDPLKSELPRTEEMTIRKGVSERYFKRALFTLQHYQSAASSSGQAGF